ncbi:SRPBCC family protein [Natronorubrum sp. FCH18a]|uniref:SRPBCC family protein n=1 Tax=Natronorubrum sp. FCH18a TaxID=3447018 RepID=UPI003F517610
MAEFELETTIRAPIGRVFDLSRSVDVHVETMSEHDESAVGGPPSGLLAEDDRVTWRARHFGVPLEMTVEITAYENPTFFRDELVDGPFARLSHDHHFTEISPGVTRMRDEFAFSAPGGPIGTLAARLYLERYMRRLLTRRNARLKRVAESEAWKSFLD